MRLDYLRPPQAWALLQSHCAHLGLQAPAGEQARLARLQQLTPGDFAAVLRQSRFKPLASAADWLAALESECALKEGGKQVISLSELPCLRHHHGAQETCAPKIQQIRPLGLSESASSGYEI